MNPYLNGSHLLTLTLSFFTALAFSSGAQAKLEVHEWGTFTSLVGSDGKAQNGMVREDEALPSFVHDFGEKPAFTASLFAHAPFPSPTPEPFPSPNDPDNHPMPCHPHSKIGCDLLLGQVITQKMETPVVYFYADRAQRVSFEVGFPNGVVSQSFPAATVSRPLAVPGVALRNGFAGYDVQVLKEHALLPTVDAANIYSHARNTKSDLIRVGAETEKFIFYRGLGGFETQVNVTSAHGALKLANIGTDTVPKAFLVFTDETGGSIEALASIEPGTALSVSAQKIAALQAQSKPFSSFATKARSELQKSLIGAGLFEDEARAMLDTWEHGYFRTPGLRVLYVLSRGEVESILPAKVSPAPEHFERAFVGRIEILTDTREKSLLREILRDGEAFDVSKLGRMASPILERLTQVALENGQLDARASAVFASLQLRAALD